MHLAHVNQGLLDLDVALSIVQGAVMNHLYAIHASLIIMEGFVMKDVHQTV